MAASRYLAVGLSLSLAGCVVHRYEPKHANTNRFPGLVAEVQETEVTAGIDGHFREERVRIKTKAAEGTRLVGVAVTSPGQPCGSGFPAHDVAVDNAAVGRNADFTGSRSLVITLPVDISNKARVLELQLAGSGPPRCVHVPLPAPRDWDTGDSWTVGTRGDFIYMDTPLVEGSPWAWGIGFELGRWFGPMKVAVALGGTVVLCGDGYEQREGEDNAAPAGPLGKVELVGYPLIGDPLSLGAVLRIEAGQLLMGDAEHSESATWFGPLAGVRLSVAELFEREHPYPRSPKTNSLAFEVSGGSVIVSSHDGTSNAMRLGASLLLPVPF